MTRYAAKGTLLKRGDGGDPTETFTTVGQIISVNGIDAGQLEMLDVTDMDTSGVWREFIGALIEAEELSLQVHFDPDEATHQDLRSDRENRTLRNFEVHVPTTPAYKYEFAGYVVSSPVVSGDVGGKLVGDVSIKPSGAPTGWSQVGS